MFGASPILGAVLLTLSAPYSDTQGRFRLDVSEHWTLAPRFGDIAGMVFSRGQADQDPRTVQFEVRVEGMTTSPSSQRLAAYLVAKTGGTGAGDEEVRVGRYPARRTTVEYEGGHPIPGPRVVTVWALEARDIAYLLIFDRPRQDWHRYRSEIEAMLRSFEPTAKPKVAKKPAIPVEPPPVTSASSVLVGRWKSSSGVELSFSADGRFILGDLFGRYARLSDSLLELERPDGTKERFSFEQSGRRLILRSKRLPVPAIYERQEGSDREVGPSPSVSLVGTWRALAGEGALTLVLGADGRFTLGPYSGTWSIEGRELHLAQSPKEMISYNFRRERDVLWLSGGDLDKELAFVFSDG